MFFCSHRKLGSVKILFYNWDKFIPVLQFDFQTHFSYLPFRGRVTSHSLANTVQHSFRITLFEFQNMNSLQILACPGFLNSRLIIILSMSLDSTKVRTKFTSHFWNLRDISSLPFHNKHLYHSVFLLENTLLTGGVYNEYLPHVPNRVITPCNTSQRVSTPKRHFSRCCNCVCLCCKHIRHST